MDFKLIHHKNVIKGHHIRIATEYFRLKIFISVIQIISKHTCKADQLMIDFHFQFSLTLLEFCLKLEPHIITVGFYLLCVSMMHY